MLQIRLSEDRGKENNDWLNIRYSFSFAGYHVPEHIMFSSLRVLNDEMLAGGSGFRMNTHRDMEVITYMLAGELRHQNALGEDLVLKSGDVQLMTSGRGIQCSESNADAHEAVRYLQIWILPTAFSLTPRYSVKHFPQVDKENQWCLLASPAGESQSLTIQQDMHLYATVLLAGHQRSMQLDVTRSHYFHIVSGAVEINGHWLHSGDALLVREEKTLNLTANESTELLWFDLP